MLKKILNIFATKNLKKKNSFSIHISRFSSFNEYIDHTNKHQQAHNAYWMFEKNLIPDAHEDFKYSGYCYVCKSPVDFIVDFNYSYKIDGVLMPNLRESLVCPMCHLNNRMRAVVHIFNEECRPKRESNIYITEQITALYKQFEKSFLNISGSEYLGNSVNCGSCDQNGIRNEDLTRLSFSSNQFDFILSFDVFEHIPNFKKALAECYRCLKPGGNIFFTVPFDRTSQKNIIRAHLSKTGEIIHLLPPEYHGDPMNSDGCLCFHHFGWEILEDLKSLGFINPEAFFYWSKHFGYLGGEQLIFMARKE